MLGHETQKQDLIRLTEDGKLAHGYIFFGPAAANQRLFAQLFTVYLETGDFPEALPIRPLTDASVFSAVEGTIGIDVARAIREFLLEAPLIASRRTAIVDGADSMTREAENALLKIAEEPPATALLILIVRDPELLSPTLASRFQKIYFGAAAGQPRTAPDEAGIAREEKARQFLTVPAASRKDFLKELLEPEDWKLEDFLDDLIRVLAEKGADASRSDLWHAVLELRRVASSAPLNPKIQLLSLWTYI